MAKADGCTCMIQSKLGDWGKPRKNHPLWKGRGPQKSSRGSTRPFSCCDCRPQYTLHDRNQWRRSQWIAGCGGLPRSSIFTRGLVILKILPWTMSLRLHEPRTPFPVRSPTRCGHPLIWSSLKSCRVDFGCKSCRLTCNPLSKGSIEFTECRTWRWVRIFHGQGLGQHLDYP